MVPVATCYAPTFLPNGIYGMSVAGHSGLMPANLTTLVPFLNVLGDELAEAGGRTCKRRVAKVFNPRFHRGIGKASVDLLVELLDYLGRRGLRCADAVPAGRLIARHKLSHGRDVRQRVRARGGRYRQRAQP